MHQTPTTVSIYGNGVLWCKYETNMTGDRHVQPHMESRNCASINLNVTQQLYILRLVPK